jgi:hypothetical protein
METINHSHMTFLQKKHPHITPGFEKPSPIGGKIMPLGSFGKDGFISPQLTYMDEFLLDLHFSHPHLLPSVIYEQQHIEISALYNTPIQLLGAKLLIDIIKMKTIEAKMYINIKKFHTGYGSPWKEIYILKEKIDDLNIYASSFPTLQWLGEKHSMLNLMQIVLSYTIDAKFAIMTYHDWIQRGYDHIFNGNKPSITWDNLDDVTIGNRQQNYGENVKPPGGSNNPF